MLFHGSAPSWLLVDEGFNLACEREIESLFAIANGYIGTRASLEEGSALSAPATFVAGVFEQPATPGSVPQLTTFPNWTEIRVRVDGHPLNIRQGKILEHRRILNMKQGMLWRELRHRDPDGRITHLITLRLASLADRHLLVQWMLLTAENYCPTLHFESAMDLGPGLESWLPPEWVVRRNPERWDVLPLVLRAPGRDVKTAFCVGSQMLTTIAGHSERKIQIADRRIVEKIHIQAGVGVQCQLHRLVSVHTSRDVNEPLQDALTHVNNMLAPGVWAAASAHASQWETRWEAADINVEGDDSLQQALRFAIYHLVSAANPEDDRVSIGARALTGKAYKGHVFWDTEVYMLPFYVCTHPDTARALLGYRYHTLQAARDKARAAGFRGAMYAWESADTGEETTPNAVISPAGEVLNIRNGEMEVHITADIAYAVWRYWNATEDDLFFLDCGAEIMLESARFWASRGALEPDGAYHIRHVIGPDEYHEDIDDDAYTNLLAAWNLRRGVQTASLLKERWVNRWQELATRLQLTEGELLLWAKLADAMATGFNPRTLVFEQFSGYFGKEQIDLKKYEPRSASMDAILGHKRLQETNVIKQADVTMAIYLLWEDFSADVRAANFQYYEPRTAHDSSLSPSIHALVAARLGEMDLAEQYLKQSAAIDLGNTMGNAASGVHAAALGGLWQAVMLGFAGLQTCSDGLSLAPHLPTHWQRLSFPVQWRNRTIQISIDPNAVHVAVQGEHSLELRLASGSKVTARPNHEYVAHRGRQGWGDWRVLPRMLGDVS